MDTRIFLLKINGKFITRHRSAIYMDKQMNYYEVDLKTEKIRPVQHMVLPDGEKLLSAPDEITYINGAKMKTSYDTK